MSAHGHERHRKRDALRPRHVPAVTWLLSTSLIGACAAAPEAPRTAPTTEGPEEAILRIASDWDARHTEKGLRSSPSPIASFDRQVVSRLVLIRGQRTATESTTFDERFVLRDGKEVRCSGAVAGEVTVTYGRLGGEPAIELGWPAQAQQRNCDTSIPIPDAGKPAGRSRFVLRSDQLVGIEPAREKRVFLPAD